MLLASIFYEGAVNVRMCLFVMCLFSITAAVRAMEQAAAERRAVYEDAIVEIPITQEQWCDCIRFSCIGAHMARTRRALDRHVYQTQRLNRRADKYIANFAYRADLQTLCAQYTVAAAQRIMELECPEYLRPKPCVRDLRPAMARERFVHALPTVLKSVSSSSGSLYSYR